MSDHVIKTTCDHKPGKEPLYRAICTAPRCGWQHFSYCLDRLVTARAKHYEKVSA